MKTVFAHVILLSMALIAAAASGETIVIGGTDGLSAYDTHDHYDIGLALSGGGARGLAVIGILKAFEEKGIEVKAITGTSIGGIVGGLYAAGYSPDELAAIASQLDFDFLFSNSPSRKTMLFTRREERDRHLLSIRFDGLRPVIPQALTAGQKLTTLITGLTSRASYQSGADFSRMRVPFKTISTDIVSGHEVVLDSGSIADAMRATMAFPLAFTGLENENQVLMDGGMVTPIPVTLVRGMCDSGLCIVAVNTASKLLSKEELVTPLDIANQVTSIMTADQLVEQLAHADFVIDPPLGDFSSADFKRQDTIIQIGYETGLTIADSIIAFIKSHRDRHEYAVSSVTVRSLPPSKESEFVNRLHTRRLTRKELVSELKSLARELDLFRVEVDIAPEGPAASPQPVALMARSFENLRADSVTVSFTGNNLYDSRVLSAQLLGEEGVITSRSLKAGLDRVVALYHDRGFDLVHVRRVEIDPDRQSISVEIDEAVIVSVDVENNDKTRDWYVRSYFTLAAGQPYSTEMAEQGIANIYGTDLFDRVTVEVERGDGGAVVKIGVEEKESRQLRLGWHWDDEYRSEEFIELLDDNVGGIGLQYLLHARHAPHRQSYFGYFKADRILNTYLTGHIGLFHDRLDRTLFIDGIHEDGIRKEIKTGADLIFGQQIERLGAVSAGLTVEQVEYRDPDTDVGRKFDLRIIKLESLVENFDRIPFPNSGSRQLLQLQFAGKYFGGDEEFTRFYGSMETYFPIGRYLNFHPRAALGISRSGLPPSEKFYLGGMHSFTGFRTNQLAGDKMFIFSSELRVKLPLRVYFTGRHDMGEVYVSSDEIKLRNLRHAVGVALALDSPIGPFEFGYGVVNSDIDRFYVNIGLAF
ncbi:MAG: BamA/TamA family outer membrane protein [Candidatus Zixiibacteriota bacterium]|nr:MAG: BamA/TamA family outer membrane protein [candidate division Zixibacteria bacterium]